MLFNLGEGSPAKVACGGFGQPKCATVDQVLSEVEAKGKYTNAQDVNAIETMTREQRDEAYSNASEDFGYALEDQEISSKNLSNLSLAKKVAGRNDPNSEFQYLRSLAMRDRQLRANARIEMDNVKNTLDARDITNFVDADTTGGLKNKNKKYVKKMYQAYLDKGKDFTSQVDFSAYQNNPKTLSQFTNPTKDEY
jgi:hypothetical protein